MLCFLYVGRGIRLFWFQSHSCSWSLSPLCISVDFFFSLCVFNEWGINSYSHFFKPFCGSYKSPLQTRWQWWNSGFQDDHIVLLRREYEVWGGGMRVKKRERKREVERTRKLKSLFNVTVGKSIFVASGDTERHFIYVLDVWGNWGPFYH